MNKRISTMFASFLLMAGVAFAADGKNSPEGLQVSKKRVPLQMTN